MQEYLEYLERNGIAHTVSQSIIPPAGAHVLFTICGSIHYRDIIEGRIQPTHKRIGRIQRCLRTDNLYAIGVSPKHTTVFDLAEYFEFSDINPQRALQTISTFLLEQKLQLRMNIPDSGSAFATSAKAVASHNGINQQLMNPVALSVAIKGSDLEGERVEIGTDAMELWNISYVLGKVIDSGAAVQRIRMCKDSLSTIYDLEEFKPYIARVKSAGYRDEYIVRYIADQARTLDVAFAQQLAPSSKGAGNKLRMLIKKVCAVSRIERPISSLKTVLDCRAHPEIDRMESLYHKCASDAYRYATLEDYICATTKEGLSDKPKLLNEEFVHLHKIPFTKEYAKQYGIPLVFMKYCGKAQ